MKINGTELIESSLAGHLNPSDLSLGDSCAGCCAMKHQITYDEACDYSFSSELAGSYGPDEHKTLTVTYYINNKAAIYEVLEKRVLVLMTDSLARAVEKYNSL